MYRVKTHLSKIHCLHFYDISQPIAKAIKKRIVKDKMVLIPEATCLSFVNKLNKITGTGGNKLQNCNFSKIYQVNIFAKLLQKTENTVQHLQKFRTVVASIRIEIGRYEGLFVQERTCIWCKDLKEDEFYVLFAFKFVEMVSVHESKAIFCVHILI